ncbi:colicin E5-related ribonuclease [Paenibacillus xylanilyticus]|uniref:colicin E5-related ribonuclease n=1 Tax=Paenibacillus xylanilyticus TaxID=248903 RepID=UPI0039A1C2BB
MTKIQIPVNQMTHTVGLFKLGHGHLQQILDELNSHLTPLIGGFEGETAERFAHLYRYAEKNLNNTLELLHMVSLRLEQIRDRFVDTDSTMVNISALLDYQANPSTPLTNDLVCGPNDPPPKRSIEEHVDAFFNQAGENIAAMGDSILQLGKDFIEHPLDTAGELLYDNTIGTVTDIGNGIVFAWNYGWDNGDTREQAEKQIAAEFDKMRQDGGAEYAANITTSMLLGVFGRRVGLKSIDGKQHHSPHTDSGGSNGNGMNSQIDSYSGEPFHYSQEPTKRGGKSIADQITERGWNDQRLSEAINEPAGTVDWVDQRKGQNNAPVTVYYHKDSGYVVRRNDTGEIIQVSQVDDPDWSTYWSDDDIKWVK